MYFCIKEQGQKRVASCDDNDFAWSYVEFIKLTYHIQAVVKNLLYNTYIDNSWLENLPVQYLSK